MRNRFKKEQPIRLTKEEAVDYFIESYQFLHYLGKQKSTIAAPEKKKKRSGETLTKTVVAIKKVTRTLIPSKQSIRLMKMSK
jgi:hypothetical protein